MSKYNCSSCRAIGLYRGLCEKGQPGVAVICIKCKGSGAVESPNRYDSNPMPFTTRVARTDITTVYNGNGTMIFFGAGPKGNGISYQEFLNGKLPA